MSENRRLLLKARATVGPRPNLPRRSLVAPEDNVVRKFDPAESADVGLDQHFRIRPEFACAVHESDKVLATEFGGVDRDGVRLDELADLHALAIDDLAVFKLFDGADEHVVMADLVAFKSVDHVGIDGVSVSHGWDNNIESR